MEQSHLTRRKNIGSIAAALLAVGAALAVAAWMRPRGTDELSAKPLPVPEVERAPDGPRVRVAVLNGTTIRGLARRGTAVLRDRGYDVVDMGNARAQSDSNVIMDHGAHPEYTVRLARALGGARIEMRPDSSRYLDITVVLGVGWKPPARPFYP